MTAKPLQIKIIFAADEVCMVLRDMLRGQAKTFSVDQGQSKTNPFQANARGAGLQQSSMETGCGQLPKVINSVQLNGFRAQSLSMPGEEGILSHIEIPP